MDYLYKQVQEHGVEDGVRCFGGVAQEFYVTVHEEHITTTGKVVHEGGVTTIQVILSKEDGALSFSGTGRIVDVGNHETLYAFTKTKEASHITV